METQITGSVRPSSGTTLKVCLNFKSEIVKQFDLNTRKFVEITIRPDRKYRLRFLESNNGRCRPIQCAATGARVFVDQQVFKLNLTEKRVATVLEAVIEDDCLVFDFNPDQFVNGPSVLDRKINKLASKKDKVEAGFTPDSAWGEAFTQRANERIRDQAIASLKTKIEVFYGRQ